jgi:hypothetical protein
MDYDIAGGLRERSEKRDRAARAETAGCQLGGNRSTIGAFPGRQRDWCCGDNDRDLSTKI